MIQSKREMLLMENKRNSWRFWWPSASKYAPSHTVGTCCDSRCLYHQTGNPSTGCLWLIKIQATWRESVSKPCSLNTGVPQCSAMGPLLFSRYTISIGSAIDSKGFSYYSCADDTQLILSLPQPETQAAAESLCLADISVAVCTPPEAQLQKERHLWHWGHLLCIFGEF